MQLDPNWVRAPYDVCTTSYLPTKHGFLSASPAPNNPHSNKKKLDYSTNPN